MTAFVNLDTTRRTANVCHATTSVPSIPKGSPTGGVTMTSVSAEAALGSLRLTLYEIDDCYCWRGYYKRNGKCWPRGKKGKKGH